MEIDDIQPLLGRSWLGLWHGPDREQGRGSARDREGRAKRQLPRLCPTPSGEPKWWAVT